MNKSGYRAMAKHQHKFTALLLLNDLYCPWNASWKCQVSAAYGCAEKWYCPARGLPCLPGYISRGFKIQTFSCVYLLEKKKILTENKAPPIICSVLKGRVQKYHHFGICKATYCSFLHRQWLQIPDVCPRRGVSTWRVSWGCRFWTQWPLHTLSPHPSCP